MIIVNRNTGQRFEVLSGTRYSKDLYYEEKGGEKIEVENPQITDDPITTEEIPQSIEDTVVLEEIPEIDENPVKPAKKAKRSSKKAKKAKKSTRKG